MTSDWRDKLSKKHMTRREFLQFSVGSLLVLFGLSNVIALMGHLKKTADSPLEAATPARHGFGSRKFGA